MPGINFVTDFNNRLKDIETRISHAQNIMKHRENYHDKILLSNDKYFLGYVKYEEYPTEVFEDSSFLIFVEGRIYNKSSEVLKKELFDLARSIAADKVPANDILKKWILSSDGEYVIFLLDKGRNRIIVFNDVFGRLPLYYSKNGSRIIISREIKFITKLMDSVSLNRQAVAEYLLFRFPLLDRTLIKGVSRVNAGAAISVDMNSKNVESLKIYSYNLDGKENFGKSVKDNANEIERLFLDSCQNRIASMKDYTPYLSLSGGLDSRSIAAALKKMGVNFYSATYLNSYITTGQHEVDIAQKVAKALDLEWKKFDMIYSLEDIKQLTKIKDGLNYAGMAALLPCLRDVMDTYDVKTTYWTGDGGDKQVPNIRPATWFKNIDALRDYLIDQDCLFNIDQAAAISGFDKNELKESTLAQVEAYPTKDLLRKYIHWRLGTRAFKWLYEGEDRNRFYFWTVAPFYSYPFFNYAMNVSDGQKRYFGLYREFLISLNPRVAEIDNVNWDLPITSGVLPLRLFIQDIYQLFPLIARAGLKSVLKFGTRENYRGDPKFVSHISDTVKNHRGIQEYISEKEIENLIHGNCSEEQFYILMTLVEYMSELLK